MNRLSLHIAARYLFAGKSHNVINRISAISAAGMAVGTAALIIILSVYNGFDALVKSTVASIEPDIAVVPSEGKFFSFTEEMSGWLEGRSRISSFSTTLQDNVFAEYGGLQGTARVKGVDDAGGTGMLLSPHITDGEFILDKGEIRYAAVGRDFARKLDIGCGFNIPLKLFYPDRYASFSAANPMSLVNMTRVWPSCEFSVNSDMDASLVIVSADVMRRLLGVGDDEVSAIDIRVADGTGWKAMRRLKKEISLSFGDGVKVLGRMQQNPALYKMLRYEKMTVYLIMVFIVLILGFSIFGSLTMLIIEKEEDIATLRALGADSGMVHGIFAMEGWFITLSGMAAGLVAGIVFCILQQTYGIVKMPGSYIVDAYPVVLEWIDVLVSAVSISLLGWLIALVPARRVKLQNVL